MERKKGYFPVTYVCTTEYDATMPNVLVAFPHRELTNIFGEYIARQGYTQLRIAETEKYAHVTFFFNGGAEQVFPGGPLSDPLPQGGHLRSPAGDERPRGHRGGRQAH